MKTGNKKKEDKFIVINVKRFAEMREFGEAGYIAVAKLTSALASFDDDYIKYTGKTLNQKYIVCNQDEPYAERVWNLVLNRTSQPEPTEEVSDE